MNLDLTEAQQMVQQMVRTFTDKEVRPRAAEIDRTDTFPRDLYRRLGELGVLGMTWPAEYGGAGVDTVTWAIAQEEVARGCPALIDAGLLCKLMGDLLVAVASPEHKAAHVPALGRGEKICAIAQTEPGTGSDVAGIRTTARETADGYVLNGTKRFITCGGVCDLAVVVATTDPSRSGHEAIALFLVETGTPGFRRGTKERVMGLHGMETSELVFEDCHIPRTARLAAPGDGFRRAMLSLDIGRVGIGAQAVGIAQAALDEAVKYAKERVAFGAPIAKLGVIEAMVADMSTQVEAARLLVRRAAWLKDQGRSFTRAAAEAKLFAAELAVKATNDALQIHGGYGYTTEFPIERLYRDARVYPIFEGTSQIQRRVIARQLFR